MASFGYAAPTSIKDATRLLRENPEGTLALGGGTDLLVQIRSGRIAPQFVVDLKRLPGAIGIRQDAGCYVIGGATPCAMLGEHVALAVTWPGVVEAASLIGSVQVQGRATLAGNLCNASPAADSVPAMIAAAATCVIVGPEGQRELLVEHVNLAPGRNSLSPGEFVLEIRLPARPARSADSYLRTIPRTEMDIAVVGAAVDLTLDEDGICTSARVALGAVSPTTILVPDAGAALVGTHLGDEALSNLEAAVRAACRPISDKRGTVEYRTALAGTLARRVAKIAYRRAEER